MWEYKHTFRIQILQVWQLKFPINYFRAHFKLSCMCLKKCKKSVQAMIFSLMWICYLIIYIFKQFILPLAEGNEGGGLPCPFSKIEKSALILKKCALFVCIYGLNSQLKCSFKGILEKHMKRLSKCTHSKKPPMSQKIPGFNHFTVSKLRLPNPYCIART